MNESISQESNNSLTYTLPAASIKGGIWLGLSLITLLLTRDEDMDYRYSFMLS